MQKERSAQLKYVHETIITVIIEVIVKIITIISTVLNDVNIFLVRAQLIWPILEKLMNLISSNEISLYLNI